MDLIDLTIFTKLPDDSTEEIGRITININHSKAFINPNELLKALPSLANKGKMHGFNANISCDRLTLIVEGFEYISIIKYNNAEASFAYLKVYDACSVCRLNGLDIKRLDCERSTNVLLANSTADEVYIGIEGMRQEDKPQKLISHSVFSKSDINKLVIHESYNHIQISGTNINSLYFDDKCEDIIVIDNSLINRLSLNSYIKKYTLKNSAVTDFEFLNKSRIDTLELLNYSINRAYGCKENSIQNKSIESWKLVADSAKQNEDIELYTKSGYEYMKMKQRGMPFGLQKIGYLFLQKTCGFGYKPLYTLGWAVGVWLVAGLIFWILTFFFNAGLAPIEKTKDMSLLSILGNSLYYSTITFTTTGYGDFSPYMKLAKMCAGLEAVSGSTLMALLIFSLTKRYGSFK